MLRNSRIFFGLILAAMAMSCYQEPSFPNAKVTPQAVLKQLKSYAMAAAVAAEKNVQAAQNNKFIRNLTGGGMAQMAGGDLSDPEGTLAKAIGDVFDSEFVSELFNDTNIVNRTDEEIVYNIQRHLCNKSFGYDDFTPGRTETDQCRAFLDQNILQLRVRSLDGSGIEVALLFKERDAPDAEELQMVGSVMAKPTELSHIGNLAGLHRLATAIQKAVFDTGSQAQTTSLIDRLEGMLSWKAGFRNGDHGTGCADDSDICFTFNIDQDVVVESKQNGLSVNWSASPAQKPTLYLAGGKTNTAKAQLNMGRLLGSLGGLASVKLDALQADISLPNLTDAEEGVLSIENLSFGETGGLFDLPQGKITLDLSSNDGKVAKMLKIISTATGAVAELSPFTLLTSFEGKDEGCKTKESISVNTIGEEGKTRLSWEGNILSLVFASSQEPVKPEPSLALKENAADGEDIWGDGDNCTESKLYSYPGMKAVKVADSCPAQGVLKVEQGEFKIGYDYSLNGKASSLTHDAKTGQCLMPANS